MIHIKIKLLIVGSLALCVSCNDNKPPQAYVPLKDVLGTPSAAPASGVAGSIVNGVANGSPEGNSVSLNPPHGQPGHRCDIGVGQPLPQQTPPPAPAEALSIAPPPVTAQPSTAAGLNPAHGQPGHRCDIAVGAPLNSKPEPQATTVASTSTKKTKVAPGMNPPHGEPGHRCDIAVGSPLNQAVAKTETEKKDSAGVQSVKFVDSSSQR